jgi:hypothetical protein
MRVHSSRLRSALPLKERMLLLRQNACRRMFACVRVHLLLCVHSAAQLGSTVTGMGSIDIDVVEVSVVGEDDEEPSEPRELTTVRAHGVSYEKGRRVAEADCGVGGRGRTNGEHDGKDAEVHGHSVTKIQEMKHVMHLRSRGEVRSVSSRM